MSRPSVTYINQLAYADVPYPTTLNPGDVLREPYPSVARAGCGLCCVCMMVEFLTGERLSVEACINLSIRAGANYYGTDMNPVSYTHLERVPGIIQDSMLTHDSFVKGGAAWSWKNDASLNGALGDARKATYEIGKKMTEDSLDYMEKIVDEIIGRP